MDFKFRLKQGENTNRNTIGGVAKETPSSQAQNSSGWDRYARKTSPAPAKTQEQPRTSQPMQTSAKSQNQPLIKTTTSNLKQMSRYYRSDAAPSNQFKHYLSNGNNVFYEQRQSLKQIKTFGKIKRITGILWFIMLVVSIALFFITPFDKQCPANAQCGVFVHCFHGFQYNKDTNQCVLSEDMKQRIEEICFDMIQKARQNWGDRQCGEQSNKIDTAPTIRLQDILSSIQSSSLKRQVKIKLQQFLQDPKNQDFLEFNYQSQFKTIQPRSKQYSLFCRLKMLTHTFNFRLGLPLFLLVSILLIVSFVEIRKRIIAKKIYKQLRRRTEAEKQKLLNISYAKPELQKQFGTIDEKMWELVDQLRSKDRDIGFLQDDFLYWKIL